MRYQCVHCDKVFELAAEGESRCPNCMRQHGLRAVASSGAAATGEGGAGASGSGRGRALVGLALLLLVAGGGGAAYYYTSARMTAPTDPALLARTPLGERALRSALVARGVDEREPLAQLFAADDAVERFAEAAASGKERAADKAAAVVLALKARATARAYAPWSMADPLPELPRTAAQTLAALATDGAQRQLYPLEVAALGVAALRALDVPAMLVEVKAVPGERSPLDPSGRFGYFAVAIDDGGRTQLFDAYGGRTPFAPKDVTRVSDIEAVGAALSLRACGRLARNEDPAPALRDADLAIKLLPGSASVRSTRGTVLLANAASDLGASELQAAAQMSPDAPRKNNLAMLELVQGDSESAARVVSQALAEYPDFALAHVTLAAVHLSSGEREQARDALEKAEALDPALPAVAMTWSQYYASGGQTEQALNYAKRAVEARPNDPQARLLLAGLYRQAARYDAMRVEARKVLELTPGASASRMRELIARLLGPTALEPADEPAAAEPTAEPAEPAANSAVNPSAADAPGVGRLELKPPAAKADSPLRLLDDESGAPSTGTLKAQDGTPKLQLKAPGLSLGNP